MKSVTYAIYKCSLLFNDYGSITLNQLKGKTILFFLCRGKKRHWHSGNLILTELDTVLIRFVLFFLTAVCTLLLQNSIFLYIKILNV